MVTFGEHRELLKLPDADLSMYLFVACGVLSVVSSCSVGGKESSVVNWVFCRKYPNWFMASQL